MGPRTEKMRLVRSSAPMSRSIFSFDGLSLKQGREQKEDRQLLLLIKQIWERLIMKTFCLSLGKNLFAFAARVTKSHNLPKGLEYYSPLFHVLKFVIFSTGIISDEMRLRDVGALLSHIFVFSFFVLLLGMDTHRNIFVTGRASNFKSL